MSLSGNLRTMDLSEILQWISSGHKTGTLHLERRSVQKRIVFRKGVIYTSWSNDPRESLGQFLVRDGWVSEEQLFRALLQQEHEGALLGAILVSTGILTEDTLRRSLREKAEETIYDLFLWPEGRFEFKEGELPTLIEINMEVTGVIMEGIRRVDEWARMRDAFGSPLSSFKVKDGGARPGDPAEARALDLAAAGRSLAEIALDMHRSEFDAASLLFALHGRGLVEAAPAATEALADPVGTIHDLLAAGGKRLEERRYEEAMAAYEEVLALDRLNQNAKKGLIAVVEARGRDRALRKVPLEKVPVLCMDMAELTRQDFDPQEGFVLSRVNGEWDVRSILKLCPMGEEVALLIVSRLLERKVIRLQ
ncbi:MAG TPA: DUF4388 domain-containing protein [Vicinamibacteria bacterium]|nr:DUF4388 domain-containing protein [Vicinamibacteria bacterium]